MLEVKITITAPDLTAAIDHLATAIGIQRPYKPYEAPKVQETAKQPEENAPEETTQEDKPVVEPAPMIIEPGSKKPVTLQMLSEAGAKLLDRGKMTEVIAALGKYGVPSLTALKPESYWELAEDFKRMGVEVV